MKISAVPSTMSRWKTVLAPLLLSCVLALFEWPSLSIGQTLTLAQFNHTAWTSKDGAPADAWAMAQTPDGWLWFGAADGLYRFDGVQFEHVELQGLGPKDSRSISTLYASESGALWIGRLNSGVTLLKDGHFIHFGETVGFGGSTIAIAEDSSGGTWVSCAVALLRYDGATWSRIGKDWGFPDQYAISVFKDRQGRLWIEGQHGIFTVDLKSRRLTPRDIRVQGIGEFIESPDGRTWFADEAGVQVLPDQTPGELNPAVSNARASYGTIIDRIGSIWRSGEAKVERRPLNLSSSELRFRGDPDQFSTREGLSGVTKQLLEDREGNVWVTTTGGVDRFRPVHVLKLPLSVSELGRHALAPSEHGNIWIGSHLGVQRSASDGLWKFDGQLRRITGVGNTPITAVNTDTDGKLWIAGPDGVWKEEGAKHFRKVAELPQGSQGQHVQSLTIDFDGDPWISVLPSSLFRRRNGTWELNGNLKELAQHRFARVQVLDQDGWLWLAYTDQLVIIKSGEARTLSAAEGLDVGEIDALHVGVHTVVAGANRVQVLQEGRFHALSTPTDPTVLEGVTGIVESQNGDLWFNGVKGAVHVTAAAFEGSIKSGTYQVPFELFDAEDGYPGMAQRVRPLPTLIEGSDGRLWFAGTTNVATIDPKHMRHDGLSLPVAIRGVRASGHAFPPAGTQSLAAGTRDLQVDYTALLLGRPDRVRFRYQLEGFDKGWVNASMRRQAFYTNLDPGRYRFRVAAANESGVWTDSGDVLDITIAPTFLQSQSFKALCGAAVILMFGGAYALRMRYMIARMRARLEERVAERERIARELHDTLLQSVQGLILKFQDVAEDIPGESAVRRKMEDALDRADDLLAESRDRVKQLRISPAAGPDLPPAVGAAGAKLASEYSIPFNLVVEGVQRPVMPIIREEVLRIAHEALSNAYRHARATKVEAEIIYGRAELRVRIRDDGCGIDDTMMRMGRPDHWGMAGMRERAKKITASFDIWSRPSAGTEIELIVPGRVAYLRSGWGLNWRAARTQGEG